MRVLFIVASAASKDTAGVRIRYGRLGASASGLNVRVEAFENLTEADLFSSDVYVFSKTYSVPAGIVAKRLAQIGKAVGIDLFDDYFSQEDDPRLLRFRDWLREFGPAFGFALCSTPVMQQIAAHYWPSLPVLLLPDPFPALNEETVAPVLAAKLETVRREKQIDVLWFGIGSNPFFPVGIKDLAAYSGALADLAGRCFKVRLVVLTDKGSLSPANLARMAKIPVPYTIQLWSVEAEKKALESSFATFIPVNGQSFSRAKSLNRALTATLAGNQVLSPGFPLYREIGDFVYDDAKTLLGDVDIGECRLRGETLPALNRALSEYSGIETLGSKLSHFLQARLAGHTISRIDGEGSLSSNRQNAPLPELAVMYGSQVDPSLSAATKVAGILTIRTPLTRQEVAADVLINHLGEGKLEIWLRPDLKALVGFQFRSQLSPPAQVGKRKMVKIAPPKPFRMRDPQAFAAVDPNWVLQETSTFRDLVVDLRCACQTAFPTLEIHLSDPNPYARTTLVPIRQP